MSVNLEELERLAKAVKGPWDLERIRIITDHQHILPSEKNYIAAANPKTILEMIEEIKNLRKELKVFNYR